MSPESVHIVVDVHVDGDQIVGCAGDGVTEPRPFSGWLGLIGALDGLVRVVAEGERRTGGGRPSAGDGSLPSPSGIGERSTHGETP